MGTAEGKAGPGLAVAAGAPRLWHAGGTVTSIKAFLFLLLFLLSAVSLEAEAPVSPGSILPPAEGLGRHIFTATLVTAWLNMAWPGLCSPVSPVD